MGSCPEKALVEVATCTADSFKTSRADSTSKCVSIQQLKKKHVPVKKNIYCTHKWSMRQSQNKSQKGFKAVTVRHGKNKVSLDAQ